MNIIKPVDIISTPAIGTSAGTAIASSATGTRAGFGIQNLSANPLFVRFGGTASTTVFHVILPAATGADNGTSAIYQQLSGSVWQGEVSVAGTSPRFVAWEY